MTLPFVNCRINMWEGLDPFAGHPPTRGGVNAAILTDWYPYGPDERLYFAGGALVRLLIEAGFVIPRPTAYYGGSWTYLLWWEFANPRPTTDRAIYQVTTTLPIMSLAGVKYWRCSAVHTGVIP